MYAKNGSSSTHAAIMQLNPWRAVEESQLLYFRRAWKRIPPHALCELQDLGFFPPRAAGAMLLDQPKIDRTQDDKPAKGHRILGDLGDIPR